VLGFMNAYFMIYSFVCDHWVYLSTLGPIALAAAGFARWTARMRSPALAQASAGVVLAWLAFLSWSQAGTFLNNEILFRTAIARNPNAAMAHNNLGMLLFQKGMREDDSAARAEGIGHLRRALELQPKSAHAHNNLGNALLAGGQPREAMKQYQESLDLDPSNPDTCNNVASMLATSSDPSLRNGAKAVELAQKANQLLGGRSPVVLGTLAAAYAEAGDFPAAQTTVAEALRLVADNPESRLAQMLMAQSNLYSAGLPFHEP
jgi:tetratricopeptide (TPR) repeat protein